MIIVSIPQILLVFCESGLIVEFAYETKKQVREIFQYFFSIKYPCNFCKVLHWVFWRFHRYTKHLQVWMLLGITNTWFNTDSRFVFNRRIYLELGITIWITFKDLILWRRDQPAELKLMWWNCCQYWPAQVSCQWLSSMFLISQWIFFLQRAATFQCKGIGIVMKLKLIFYIFSINFKIQVLQFFRSIMWRFD